MGPLQGTRIIELKGLGPGPYAGMLLADMGAEVIVVERASSTPGIAIPAARDVHARGKQSIALDLKTAAGLDALLRIIDDADALLEGFRPGVAERLGFGPAVCHARNPALVYGRVTGWGQYGPLAQSPGHDINFIALTGALAAIGTREAPVPPLNVIGDYAAGSLFLVMGMLAAMLSARQSGQGQVVDAAITDGSASLMSGFYGWQQLGFWQARRGANLLDGAAHHYNVYATSDGEFLAVGALEPQFYAELIRRLELDEQEFGGQQPIERWPALIDRLREVFAGRTLAEWCELLEGSDACVAPVLDINAATRHPHNIARHTYIDIDGVRQPAPAPRFSATPCATPAAPHAEGSDSDAVLGALGFSAAEIAALRDADALT